MKPVENLGRGAQIAIIALVALGFIGGCLIIALSGFETLPKTRSTQRVFVPLPEAYLMAAAMYGQPFIGMLVILRAKKVSKIGIFTAVMGYAAAPTILVSILR